MIKRRVRVAARTLLMPLAGLWDPLLIRWVQRRTGFELPIPPIRLRQSTGGTGANAFWFVESGREDARVLLEGMKRHAGRDLAGLDALDFGSGIGRLLSHFHRQFRSLTATDVDETAIAWTRRTFPAVACHANDYAPPLRYGAETFDLAYSFSVWTHLSEADQITWLKELARILRPGGLALLSAHTLAGLPENIRRHRQWQAVGQRDVRTKGIFFTNYSATGCAYATPEAAAKTNPRYGYTIQTVEQIRESWGKIFDVLEIEEAAFRKFQTLVVLRKRRA